MRKKILIVESDQHFQSLLVQKLKVQGYDVLAIDSGFEILNLINIFWPDLMILDVDLPQVTGFDVLEELNRNKVLDKIPTIVIANSNLDIELIEAKGFKIKDWLVKTEFGLDDFLQKVAEVLKQK